jgi:uncharacterized protein with von Willebrand factor type A (vWA) domain
MLYHKNVTSYSQEIANNLHNSYAVHPSKIEIFQNLFVSFYEWNWDLKADCPSDIREFLDQCSPLIQSFSTMGNVYTSYIISLRLAQYAKIEDESFNKKDGDEEIKIPSASDVERAKKAVSDLEGFMQGMLPGKGSLEMPRRPDADEVSALCKSMVQSLSNKVLKKTLNSIAAIAKAIEMGMEKVESNESLDFGYDFGRDIKSLMPEELVALATPETRRQFNLKYAKGELLQAKESPTPKGLGDILILKDRSGSTHKLASAYNCSVSDYMSAIFAAIALFQSKKKHKVKLVEFDYKILYQSDWIYSKVKVSTEVLKAAARIPAGGTDTEIALDRAMGEIQKNTRTKYSKTKQGIILLTDGYDHLSDDFVKSFNALKKEYGVKLYTYIFCQKLDPKVSVGKVSDKIYNIDPRLKVEEQMDKLYNAVIL